MERRRLGAPGLGFRINHQLRHVICAAELHGPLTQLVYAGEWSAVAEPRHKERIAGLDGIKLAEQKLLAALQGNQAEACVAEERSPTAALRSRPEKFAAIVGGLDGGNGGGVSGHAKVLDLRHMREALSSDLYRLRSFLKIQTSRTRVLDRQLP